jgi:PAS domain S-box-containing protein
MTIGFGPATLTGGPIQAGLGSLLMIAVGYFLGRTRNQNKALFRELEGSHAKLEFRVQARTAELTRTNSHLLRENAERLQAEEALVQSEIYFRRLIENAMDVVTVLNPDGTIRYESPSVKRVLGYEPEELIGQNAFEYLHPDDAETVRKEFERGTDFDVRFRIVEFRFRHKDGSWRTLEAIGNNLLSDPILNGVVINSRDVTKRRELEIQFQRQNSLAVVGQLAAGIAHDFNNVMAVILLYAQLLDMSPNLTPKEKKQVNTRYKEGQRAAALTAQILDFGRQSILQKKPMDLLPFMEEFVVLLRRTLADNYEVDLIAGQDSYVVTADSGRLQQALMNMTFNSRDAMPGGGRIEIQLANIEFREEDSALVPNPSASGWVEITVSDTGSGISNDNLRHIFEPFFSTKEPGKGTGLGLAQVYGIVKQHNGFIDVTSDIDGGTRMKIILPKGNVDETPRDDETSQGELIEGNNEIILVVEDNDATRMALLASLESLNYKVFGVRNGLEAISLLERNPDTAMVISDVMMPQMGGIALFDALQSQGSTIPFILLTGNSASEEMALVKVSGQVDWYNKPIHLNLLSKIVANKIG